MECSYNPPIPPLAKIVLSASMVKYSSFLSLAKIPKQVLSCSIKSNIVTYSKICTLGNFCTAFNKFLVISLPVISS